MVLSVTMPSVAWRGTAQKSHIADLKSAVSNVSGGGGWKFPFFLLFVMILGLAGVGYNRYAKLYGKSHLP